ncbi:Cys-tRNA(Pro) deacylase [Butyrivibrio sp. JL13D10]|uniref:Cys-tRNA(Pro) deacylase n=1 Tax=Butyrivibrio sp. JL13D10 TaxID=3236815 RepID=UPI0038B4E2AB
MAKEEKTNVMRVLDGKKIEYTSHSYKPDATMSGEEIAGILGENPDKVFKTLVTQGKSGQYFVFVVPVKEELNLKKAAAAASEKSVSMIKQKELLPLTGYVHGGCSPIGMKKQFKTFVHETAEGFDRIFVSAGKVGYQIELSPQDLIAVSGAVLSDII